MVEKSVGFATAYSHLLCSALLLYCCTAVLYPLLFTAVLSPPLRTLTSSALLYCCSLTSSLRKGEKSVGFATAFFRVWWGVFLVCFYSVYLACFYRVVVRKASDLRHGPFQGEFQGRACLHSAQFTCFTGTTLRKQQ
jgi:hypothetical protein